MYSHKKDFIANVSGEYQSVEERTRCRSISDSVFLLWRMEAYAAVRYDDVRYDEEKHVDIREKV